jgi:DNA invertase Pin-like site-specific DNA recombinase
MKKFYAILRVSTEGQKESSLGIKSQKQSIENYVKSVGGELIGMSEECLTGGYKEKIVGNVSLETLLKPRPQLLEAIEICKKEKATLIVKEASRLSRSPLVIEFLINSGIDFVASDSPQDTPLLIRIKSAINADELTKISERTKAALNQRKQQLKQYGQFISNSGTICHSLGSPANIINHNRGRKKAAPSPQMSKVKSYVESLRKNGLTLETISVRLNSDGYRTPKNCMFTKGQISRLLK